MMLGIVFAVTCVVMVLGMVNGLLLDCIRDLMTKENTWYYVTQDILIILGLTAFLIQVGFWSYLLGCAMQLKIGS